MIAGSVRTSASAWAFDAERAVACMARPGEALGLERWADDLCLIVTGPDARIHRSTERSGSVLAIDGSLFERPAGDGPDHPLLSLLARLGPDAFDRVSGDMTCAWWNAAERTLLLARDPSGYRPLFYREEEGRLLFASEPRGLFVDERVNRRLDLDYLGEWLAVLPRPSGRTAFEGIQRVPPGCAVVWRDGRTRLHRYWRPESRPLLRLRRDRDYADAVRDTLGLAVRDCLGETGGVGAHLSAGLDSAGVAAIAAEALGAQGRRLTVFTAAPHHPVDRALPPDRFGDETRLAAEVVRRWSNMDHVIVPNDAEPMMRMLDRRAAAMDGPVRNPSHAVWLDAISAEAGRRGVVTLLTAGLGNITLSHDGRFALPQLLSTGRLFALAGLLREIRRRDGASAMTLAARTLEPLMPVGLKYAVRRLLGRSGALRLDEHSAINPAFARAHGLAERSEALAGDIRNLFGADARAARLAVLDRTDQRGLWRAANRRMFGIDLRDPTADRRVLDLCLSIPEEQYVRGGGFRALARRALRDHLPATVLDERRRGLQSADWPVGLTAARAEIGAELARARNIPAAATLLDLDRMDAMVADWPGDADWSRPDVTWGYLSGLNRAAAMGRFIRQIEGGNA